MKIIDKCIICGLKINFVCEGDFDSTADVSWDITVNWLSLPITQLGNIRTCDYCEKQVHFKCLKNDLGCKKCCESILPVFYA